MSYLQAMNHPPSHVPWGPVEAMNAKSDPGEEERKGGLLTDPMTGMSHQRGKPCHKPTMGMVYRTIRLLMTWGWFIGFATLVELYFFGPKNTRGYT